MRRKRAAYSYAPSHVPGARLPGEAVLLLLRDDGAGGDAHRWRREEFVQ